MNDRKYLMPNGKFCNQWTINSRKEKVEKKSGKERPYLIAYTDTILNAARFKLNDKVKMTGNTFMVWMWLLCNKEGSQIEYSPKYLAAALGISEDSAKKAKTALVEMGYLKAVDGNPFVFEFYDKPQPVEKKVAKVKIEIPVRYFLDDNGEYQPLTYTQLAEQVREQEPNADTITINAVWNSGITSLE